MRKNMEDCKYHCEKCNWSVNYGEEDQIPYKNHNVTKAYCPDCGGDVHYHPSLNNDEGI